MNRPLKLLLIAAVTATAPVPALAQAWPTTVVAGGPRMAMTTNTTQALARVEQDANLQGRVANTPIQPPIRLKLTRVQVDDVPVVEIEPRAEWFDDQGWRVSPTRVAFKRRF